MAGTMCGGMDQTISILGEKRKAKRVEFYPKITTETVVLPESLRVVVSNTCNSVPKLNTLGTRFNRRVLECQFITAQKVGRLPLPKQFQCSLNRVRLHFRSND
jgi:galactokinase